MKKKLIAGLVVSAIANQGHALGVTELLRTTGETFLDSAKTIVNSEATKTSGETTKGSNSKSTAESTKQSGESTVESGGTTVDSTKGSGSTTKDSAKSSVESSKESTDGTRRGTPKESTRTATESTGESSDQSGASTRTSSDAATDTAHTFGETTQWLICGSHCKPLMDKQALVPAAERYLQGEQISMPQAEKLAEFINAMRADNPQINQHPDFDQAALLSLVNGEL